MKKIIATLLLALPLAGCSLSGEALDANQVAAGKCKINTDCQENQWCYVTATESYCKPNE